MCHTALAISSAAALWLSAPGEAHAQAVGDPITNPNTNVVETVAEVVAGGVITQSGLFILTTTTVNATIPDPNGSGTTTIAATFTNATTGLIDRVELADGRILNVVQPVGNTPGQLSAPPTPTAGAGDTNFRRIVVRGSNGSNGRGGAIFIPATSGDDGNRGPNLPRGGDVQPSNLGTIQINTVTNGLAGIEWSTSGGNGGNGGGSTFNLAGGGKPGGRGGAGGNVTLNVNGGVITTTGTEAHGVVAQSRSGVGGQGGSSFLATGGGGSGGQGNDGGTVNLTVGADTIISTTGDGSIGVFAQSLGGGAGGGGSSYNLFAFAGGAKDGGDGGNITLDFAASVSTQGLGSHGVFAQSLGGTGGQAGNAGGLLSFGDNGSGGGNGGTVSLTMRSTGIVRTDGFGSHGVFAQSVGGGGGASGTSVGLGTFGAGGGSGGDGGNVTVTTEAGSQITTLQDFSHGLFAQSVGGGGGAGGTSVGLVTLGASGGGGGNASTVTVTSASDISTSGSMSRGIFAQSVGGGGGSANAAVGLLAIGGNSSDGGTAQEVNVNASGSITTTGALSTGILAQSVGGGGGDGGMAVSGSLFAGLAIGGSGGAGGASEAVTLRMSDRTVLINGTPTQTNPTISTQGELARGIHLQSIGGGGGNGGLAVQASVGAFGAASFAIGGSGGDGGDGDLVRMFGDVNVQTTGRGAEGITLQSIGGGGGSGGGAVSVALSAGKVFSGSFSLAVGGSGGTGGDSRGALLDANGNIVASGGTETSIFMDSGGFISTEGDFATGLFAQSIGGGGGNGGFSVAVPLAFSTKAAFAVGVGVGGSGAGGGDGGRVDLTFDGGIRTEGDDALGALIQSAGGGGGNGGFNITGSLAGGLVASGAASVGVGGGSGTGGDGGHVEGHVLGAVTTLGDRSTGVLVQSTGGGGGNGGFNVSGTISAAGVGAGGVSVGVGGIGGAGGHGGNVTATADQVATEGENADGFLAQSIGGGGGNGGFSIGSTLSVSAKASGSINVGVGGSGGGGGSAGSVAATLQGDISTLGLNSNGVIAQSVGGGGGNGGFNLTLGISASKGGAGNLNVGVGGSGGSGGDAGGVNLALAGDEANEFITVMTAGDNSTGIIAQSLGGGGGNGGFNVTGGVAIAGVGTGNIGVGVGGSGGGGGNAGQVTLNANTGFSSALDGILAHTTGDRSKGLIAQSVGGGGGNGAFNFTGGLALTLSSGLAGNLGVGVGGSGGGGGQGSNVSADLHGSVLTRGAGSSGVEVSSLGGGGGSGAFNITNGIAVTTSGGVSGNIGVGVGGAGGSGGSAGNITSQTNELIVDTFGENADGVIFQSVGGGGGSGAFNITGGLAVTTSGGASGNIGIGVGGSGGAGGNAGAVDAGLTGLVMTRSADSDGVVAQSLGGGGGNGGFNITGNMGVLIGGGVSGSIGIGIGGKGGSGGDSSSVALSVLKGTGLEAARGATEELAVVTTLADRSRGVIAQSLGGAGGNGAFNITGDINVTTGGGGAGSIGVGVGGFGGGGGDASSASLTLVGDVRTGGNASNAIEVTSAGGGGGNGAFNVTGGLAITTGGGASGTIGVGVGGFGGDGGNADAVTANVRSDVLTLGDDSSGALFQSTGGGGGAGAFNVTGNVALTAGSGAGGTVGIGIGGFGGNGGDGSSVTAQYDGTIQTQGHNSTGVMAQSLGGSGGNGGFNFTGSVALSKNASGTLGFGLGGYGGDGGSSGDVSFNMNRRDPFTAERAVFTQGDNARGAVIQSLGGSGGNGAFNVTGGLSFALSGAGNIGIGIGGAGGNGGTSGAANASILGDFRTEGSDSGAILLQSVGGGGGTGGFNISGGIAGSKTQSGNLLIGVGGAGGGGGNAGAVTGVFNSSIITLGDNSYGLTAQSNGGAGGGGGFNITGGISIAANSAGPGSGVLGIGIGGAGGDGGDGANVDVTYTGDITTGGDAAHGALVQSQGGGGGNGAFNITGGVAISGVNAATVGVGVGGFGGSGGDGARVDADFTGNVTTLGDDSYGLVMQSVGGGGGAGGFNITGNLGITARSGSNAGLSVGIGGFGGDGGNAGIVSGTVNGLYQTAGADADGVLAQSLGGAGGRGGFNITGGLNLGRGNATALSFGLGGFGGGGGQSDDVTLTRIGDTITQGILSDGVVAQSIGGGGGAGGFNITGQVGISLPANNSSANHTASIGIGGFGGDGGNAGDVTLTLTGNVHATGVATATFQEDQTLDDLAAAYGFTLPEQTNSDPNFLTEATTFIRDWISPSDAEADLGETVWNQRIRILADGSHGVVAQSLGGGGGNGAFNIAGNITATTPSESNSGRGLTLGIGGFGGAGGDAATVTLRTSGDRVDIVAAGDDKHAVLAQSIGGGGGNGGFNIAGNLSLDGAATIGIGGFGSAGGLGDDVTVNVNANLFAQGNSARGMLAQSVGGGGGAGGFNITAGVTGNPNTDESSIAFGLGGFGGSGNASGNVNATHSGQILVDGFNAGGLLAQSIGGGGGDGGFNIGVNANLGGSNSGNTNPLKGYAASVGIGGDGAAGADAGNVTVHSDGNIIVNYVSVTDPGTGTTSLQGTEFSGYNFGLRAQSLGGGGGNGAFNLTGVFARQGNPLAVSVGGSGGSSGNGGTVDVTRGYDASGAGAPGTIQVLGDDSVGLAAESIGGGGGRAGAAFLLTGSLKDLKTSPGTPLSANILVGGNGGGAGSGGDVTVDHYGSILMSGRAAQGILAQSIGGGGGNANVALGAGYNSDTTSANIVIGGAPTAGGTGGDVNVTHVGLITTDGDSAEGIMAQSVGGGGGNTAMSMAVVFGQDNSLNATLGRSGGVGGHGGDVTVDFGDYNNRRDASISGGAIHTQGDQSTAIFAQSVGGGGGISSASSASISGTENAGQTPEKTHDFGFAIGADGPNGGLGGAVTVYADGLITTQGREARGIHAQSVGGGGGLAGAALRKNINTTTSFNLSVGGTGGNAGVGGTVLVDSIALIETTGEQADGILAESIGGGGGSGGYAAAIGLNFPFFSILTPAETSNSISLAFGGDGGQGAVGGAVTVRTGGLIRTTGIESHGVAARSTGGGGGQGGMAFTGRMSTSGESNNIDVSLGGSGDNGGDGGRVEVENRGIIITRNADSHGVLAHSLGGGGGSAGFVGNIDFARAANTSQTRHSITVNIGGNGGVGGDGGDVVVNNFPSTNPADPQLTDPDGNPVSTGVIETHGTKSYGVYAQSIGGGGGNGASVISLAGTNAGVGTGQNQGIQLGFTLGGTGGQGGTGGNITVSNSGLIQTFGHDSHAIVAQSIGGGGGTGGFALAGTLSLNARANAPVFAIGGRGGDGGTAGTVTVTNTGQIQTSGDRAHGIYAQSIGGGGGNSQLGLALSGEPISLALSSAISGLVGGFGMSNGGQGGAVVINQSGNILVSGDGSRAIVAESINGGGGGLAIDFTNVASLTGTPLSSSGPGGVGERTFSVELGGQGSQEQNAGRVTINTDGNFAATGRAGAASASTSVGGGGGSYDLWVEVADAAGTQGASPASSTSQSTAMTTQAAVPGQSMDINVAMGGTDGVDNNGGDLVSTHNGVVMGDGLGTLGILEQTIGGGGGRSTIVLDVPTSSQFDTFNLSMGGTNGLRERGGEIARIQNGLVVTSGDAAPGALMQSIGGGGGYSFASFSGAGTARLDSEISFGANGGFDLDGGSVTGTFSDNISTSGFASHAVILQSVGAGGGTSTILGGAEMEVRFGGDNDAFGSAGDLAYDVTGSVLTQGVSAFGGLLQSAGGGAGLVLTDLSTEAITLLARDEGWGNGGAIDASIGGSIQTLGDGAIGLAAQSAGGGALMIAAASGASGPDAQALGFYAGSAGGQGNGDNIALSIDGGVSTAGDQAFGLLAQSVGGNAGDVSSRVGGSIVTNGANAHGVILQSIGGEGGLVSGTLDGPNPFFSNLTHGDGGDIRFIQTGSIATYGTHAHGIIAQTLGGGGGWEAGAFAGSAGGSGQSGRIEIEVDGDIFTAGDDSVSVFAQSLGADGGNDILMRLGGLIRGGDGFGASILIDGGAANHVVLEGSLSAISGLAMDASIGDDFVTNEGLVVGNIDLGSGDNGFNNTEGATFVAFNEIDLRDPEPTDYRGRDLAAQADLTVNQTSGPAVSQSAEAVQTASEPAAAQTSASASTTAAEPPVIINNTQTGSSTTDLPTHGAQTAVSNMRADGVVASTDGSTSEQLSSAVETPSQDTTLSTPAISGTPEIMTLADEAVSDTQTAVTSSALTAQTQAPAGLASVTAAPAYDTATFTNSGNFLVGLSASRYPIDLLNGDTFGNVDNQGDRATNLLYGARVINTVNLDGHFVQTGTGHMAFDIAYGPYASDEVLVTGNATVDGTGEVILTWLENAERVTLFATDGVGVDNGLDIADTLAMDYSIEADDQGIHLVFESDFGQPFLNRNGRALGGHMDSAILEGDSAGIGRLMAWLGNLQEGDEELYAAIFTELNPEPHMAAIHRQLSQANTLGDDLFSCSPDLRPVREGRCIWTRIEANEHARDDSFEEFAVEGDGIRFSGGFEEAIGDGRWSLAAAFAYEDLSYKVDEGRARTSGQALSLGMGAERTNPNGWLWGMAANAGWSQMDTTRAMTVFERGFGVSEPETGHIQLRLHGAKVARSGPFFVRPGVEASITALHHAGLTETGLDGLGAEVLTDTQLIASITPELGFGFVNGDLDGVHAIMNVNLGARYSTRDELELPMRLLGANPNAMPATITTGLADPAFRVETDLTIAGGDRMSLRLGYTGEFGDTTEYHRAGFDVKVRF